MIISNKHFIYLLSHKLRNGLTRALEISAQSSSQNNFVTSNTKLLKNKFWAPSAVSFFTPI